MRLRRATAAGLLCGAVAGVAAVAALPAGSPSGDEPARPDLPGPATQGLDIPPPRPLDRAAQWAPVRRRALAGGQPSVVRSPSASAHGPRR